MSDSRNSQNIIHFSNNEIVRLQAITLLDGGHISIAEAQSRTGLGRSQVHNLRAEFRKVGPEAVVSGHRNKPSNRAYPPALREKAMKITEEQYAGYGPTLVCERLAEKHDIYISPTTIRRWMLQNGVWHHGAAKLKFHQPRQRQPQFGMQWQLDGSKHNWFADVTSCLMVAVDDATTTILGGAFFPTETRIAYLDLTHATVADYGCPLVIVTDKHSGVYNPHGVSPFTTHLAKMGVRHIHVSSPQSKGRIERMNRTLQDRLVKHLKEMNVTTIQEANAALPAFIDNFNRKFAKEPELAGDRHFAPVSHINQGVGVIRKVSRQLTVSVNKKTYVLQVNKVTRTLVRKSIRVHLLPDGSAYGVHNYNMLPLNLIGTS